MKKIKIRDLKKRQLYLKYYTQRLILKSIHSNFNLSAEMRHKAFYILKKLPYKSSITQLKNLCLITTRSKSVDSKLKISRLTFKSWINSGLLSNIFKASW